MKIENEIFEQIESSALFKLTEEERIKVKKNLEDMLKKFEVLESFDDSCIEAFDLDMWQGLIYKGEL